MDMPAITASAWLDSRAATAASKPRDCRSYSKPSSEAMAASRSTSMPTKLLSLSVNSNGAKVVSVATMYFLPEPEAVEAEPEAADVEAEPLEPPPQPARPRPRTAAEPPMRARNERRDMNLGIEGTPFGRDAGHMCWSPLCACLISGRLHTLDTSARRRVDRVQKAPPGTRPGGAGRRFGESWRYSASARAFLATSASAANAASSS